MSGYDTPGNGNINTILLPDPSNFSEGQPVCCTQSPGTALSWKVHKLGHSAMQKHKASSDVSTTSFPKLLLPDTWHRHTYTVSISE